MASATRSRTFFDIPERAPHTGTMSATERVNLNLPSDARERLRDLAKAANKPEAVYARSLLVKAIGRAERAAFKQRLEASRTPERRGRDLEIAAAFEKLRG